jgi:hypothetical protein
MALAELMNCGKFNFSKRIINNSLLQNQETYSQLMKMLLEKTILYATPTIFIFILKLLFANHIHEYRQVLLNNLLLECANFRTFDVIACLLTCGADYTYKDKSFLRYICFYENIGLLRLLIQHGLDLKAEGEFLLNCCCFFGNFIMAEFLLISGVQGIKTVCELLNFNRFDKAKFLLDHGVKKDDALIEACHSNYFLACKHLIMEGADIHQDNERALILAANSSNFPIIKLLVENKAAINKDVLLAASTSTGDRDDIVKYLIQKDNCKAIIDEKLILLAKQVGNGHISLFLSNMRATYTKH